MFVLTEVVSGTNTLAAIIGTPKAQVIQSCLRALPVKVRHLCNTYMFKVKLQICVYSAVHKTSKFFK